MSGRTLVATVATLLLATPAAQAAVQAGSSGGAVVIAGTAADESVFVGTSPSSFPGRIRVSSAGVTAGTGCVVESSSVVHCLDQPVLRTDMQGGGDRVVVTHSIRCDVCFLGSGIDQFESIETENDVVDGQTGADDLDAGPGSDTVALHRAPQRHAHRSRRRPPSAATSRATATATAPRRTG